MRRLGLALLIGYLLVCLALEVLADEVLAVSSSPWFYVVAIGLSLPVVVPALHQRPIQLVVLGYIALLFVLPFFSFMPAKPFRQFYRAIRNGMTQQEVRQELHRRFPPNGRFSRPVESAGNEFLSFQLDPNNGCYNAEIVIVNMVDGKVVSKGYFPD